MMEEESQKGTREVKNKRARERWALMDEEERQK
jgi:hypothetical protein